MASLEELEARFNALNKDSDETLEHMDRIIDETKRVIDVAHNAPKILHDLEEEFKSKTKLKKKDIGFLFFATALQCVRQYFLTDFKTRLGDKEAADATLGKKEFDPHDLNARKESGFEVRHHKLYKPTVEEVVLHPVPFDTTKGSRKFDDANPFPGTGKLGHRAGAIGHDPVLGWVFGTANIATSTLTGWNMQSFHISSKTGAGGGDFMQYRADTTKVLSYAFDKLINGGIEGKKLIAVSLIKEGVHLASDVNTKHSLPIPLVSTYSPKLASDLASYGFDMANVLTVGKQAAFAEAINMLIAMLHRITYNEDTDGNSRLYEVRTRKIITYSNAIASASNIIAVAIGSAIGATTSNTDLVKKSLSKLDIGGLAVTLFRLISDRKFIRDVKQEFIYGTFDKMIQGDF